MWHWLTLPRGRTYDIRFDEVVGMSDSTGDTSLTKGGTVEEKVASLQEQLLAAEASFNRRLVELRATVEKAVARVTDDQSAKWASADEQTKADTRRALTWPALFAALGGACQIAAALFDAWS
jgi:hypothetical protein